MPAIRSIRLASHDFWILSLIVFLPWHLGAFARQEISPIPWIAFSEAYARHGLIDGIFSLVIVVVIDMWLLFIPAHSYIVNRPDLDGRTVVIARLLNLATGLLLMTPGNPLYSILGSGSTTASDWP